VSLPLRLAAPLIQDNQEIFIQSQ